MEGVQELYTTSQVVLGWNPGGRFVFITWMGEFVSGPEYRAILLRMLDIVMEKRACRVLADTRKMPVMSAEDQQWVQKEFMPRSVRSGLKYTAIIVPKSALTKMALRHIFDDAGDMPRQRAYFDSAEEAKDWLKSVPNPH